MRTLSLISLLTITACGNPQAYYIVGQPGATGTAGVTGSSGLNGVTGATGAAGPKGLDGTVVTPVKLCDGDTVYPTVFKEYALCIEGQLYGVYSANDGFLALLVPGTYVSNAIGNSCNFTVGANCTIAR